MQQKKDQKKDGGNEKGGEGVEVTHQTESSRETPAPPSDNVIQMLDTNLVSGELEASMIKAEKYLKIQDRMRKLAVTLTSITDWVNEGDKPYLQWTGTAKIAMAFGVSYEQMVYKQTTFKDDLGEYVVFDCNGYAV